MEREADFHIYSTGMQTYLKMIRTDILFSKYRHSPLHIRFCSTNLYISKNITHVNTNVFMIGIKNKENKLEISIFWVGSQLKYNWVWY